MARAELAQQPLEAGRLVGEELRAAREQTPLETVDLIGIDTRFFDDISISRTNSNGTYKYRSELRLYTTNQLYTFC